MAQFGKATSKRGKPSYFMSILGVTIVLFFLGVVGWLGINYNKLISVFKSNIELQVELNPNATPKDSAALVTYVAGQPYVQKLEYITKEEGRKRYLDDGNDDWDEILPENPLPDMVIISPKQEYIETDSLDRLRTDLKAQPNVVDVTYPQGIVANMNKTLRQISLVLLAVVIILAVLVIILIDNTIRLAMFSNRFLIKTMQMVGATRGFIARPLNIRAIINGAVSAAIASVLLFLLVLSVENAFAEFKAVRDNERFLMLCLGLLIIGITITLISTYRSVRKYLRMKLDELY